jgi:hypothetical protein
MTNNHSGQGAGASVPDQALAVPAEPVARLGPLGFDPSRIEKWCADRRAIHLQDRREALDAGDHCGASLSVGAMLELYELKSFLAETPERKVHDQQ